MPLPSRSRLTLLAATFAVLLPAAAQADTISTTGTFGSIEENNFYDITSTGSGGFLGEAVISGLMQFDPSLGTLNSVTLEAEFDYGWNFSIEVTAIGDDSLPHDASIDLLGEPIFFFGYTETGSVIETLATEFGNAAVSCGNGGFDPGCFDELGDFVAWTTVETLDTPFGEFELADFLGTGAVTEIGLYVSLPIGVMFVGDNVDDFEAVLDVSATAGTVTLTYDYDPVPEPATAALVLLAGGALALRRRA